MSIYAAGFMANFSLRAKSLIALAIACALVLIPASWLGWLAMQSVQRHFGEAYAENLTLLNREQLLAPIREDLTLSQRLAASPLLQRWLQQEDDAQWQELFFAEAESYRQALQDQAYFLISNDSLQYYFNSNDEALSTTPRYRLDRNDPADQWYFSLIEGNEPYQININTDHQLGITRVWINVPVRNESGDPLGLTGGSLDLSRFLAAVGERARPGVTPILARADGAIQAHPDPERIAYNTAAQSAAEAQRLAGLVPANEQQALQQLLQQARANPDGIALASLTVDGTDQIVAVSHIADLDWYAVTTLDLGVAHVIAPHWFWTAAAGLVLLLAMLLAAFGYGVERLVLQPIRRLQQSARAIAAGQYSVRLPPPSDDEIGDLSRTFGEMADRVQRHTNELEDRVRERTSELEAANTAMAQAQKKIGDSIDYASLIQRAILPSRQLTQSLGPNHFVLWRPRDVVGGDFYIFHEDGDTLLLGIVDCAGHGVPGALMTMLARAAVDLAIQECGPADPSLLLRRIDTVMRAMLADSQLPRGLATNAEAGLVFVDRSAGLLRYSGARISLYASDGRSVEEYRGGRRALCDRRVGEYHNTELPLQHDTTYYLTTDGFLDQAGGEQGFGFGNQRFRELLRAHAAQPVHHQSEAFDAALQAYQGNQPQRDDITLLTFRFDVSSDTAQ